MAGVLARVTRVLPIAIGNLTSRCAPSWQTEARRSFHFSRFLLGERKFTEKHEWISVDNGIGTIGVSQYAQEQLGDIVFVQMPDVGDEFKLDEEFGALESVKAASDLYSPVTGRVTAINSDLEDDPSLVNKAPYDEGWIVKMELKDQSEFDSLMDEKAYKEFVEKEAE